MTDLMCPVAWAGRRAVMALPERIDASNAGQIRGELLLVIDRSAGSLIADMTETVCCDHIGAQALKRACQRAVISGVELRLVVASDGVRRTLATAGVDRLATICPSLEASGAARVPAASAMLTRATPGTADGARRRAGPAAPHAVRGKARTRAESGIKVGVAGRARRPDGPTPTVVRNLIDALRDGVALTDGDGTIALASRRLEEMFGYPHAELIGQPVERLIPAHLNAAHQRHRAAYARAPAARPMGAGLVALRRDGITFPVEIGLSPVASATGRFTLAVIRDVATARDRADLAAAAAADQAQRQRELLDTITASLYRLGLGLQAEAALPDDDARSGIARALLDLDDTIIKIRDAAFADRVR